eukprot:1126969-Pyramimonas_sp.AAC.1
MATEATSDRSVRERLVRAGLAWFRFENKRDGGDVLSKSPGSRCPDTSKTSKSKGKSDGGDVGSLE